MKINFTLKIRGNIIINSIKHLIKEGDKVLDIGCGNGVISKQIEDKLNCKVIGTDVLRYIETEIDFKRMDNGRLLFNDKEFDLGLIIDVLHHCKFKEQENLILEGLRVCNKLLIFELEPTRLSKNFDIIINRIHNKNMAITLTQRKLNEWISLFEKMNLDYKIIEVKASPLYPLKHYLFLVEKKEIKKE